MGIALKFYSCVGTNHTTMDALRNIRERRPFGVDDVKEVVIHSFIDTIEPRNTLLLQASILALLPLLFLWTMQKYGAEQDLLS